MAFVVAPANEPPATHRRLRRTVMIVAALMLLGGLAVVGWIWRHPTAFDSAGGGRVGLRSSVGATAFVGIADLPTDGERQVVTIESVRPDISKTIAGADIDLLLCRGGGIGAARGSIDRYCGSVEPLTGVDLTIGHGTRHQIVARVHSDRRGRVVIDAVEITYSTGWQQGSQTTGLTAVTSFRP